MSKRSERGLRTATLVRSKIPANPIGALVTVSGAKARPPIFPLREGKCTVGSSPKADLFVAEPTVSRSHATLEIGPSGVTVTDLGSRNGTFYLGSRVERITVALGSTVKLGAASLHFGADTEALAGLVLAEDSFRGMYGVSVAMRKVFATLAR